MVIQNFDMMIRGVGWQAVACPNPDECEAHFCFTLGPIGSGERCHPLEPEEFREWIAGGKRIEEIPANVRVNANAVV